MTTADLVVSPAQPRRDRVPAATLVAGVVVAAVAAVLAAVAMPSAWFVGVDLTVFHQGGSAVLSGASPYDIATSQELLFIYPPFAAILFAPLGLLGLQAAYGVWTFITVLALEAAIWLGLGLLDSVSRARRAGFTVVLTAVALLAMPVFWNLTTGQINVLLMLLVLIDLARRPGRFQGIAIGVAAGIKLVPLIFVAYLLLTRRTRPALVALASFLGTILAGFLLLPSASTRYWTALVFDTGRGTPPGSEPYMQSVHGIFVQLPVDLLHRPVVWLAASFVVGLVGLAISVRASRRGLEPAGIIACAVTGLLVSPITWTAHWVWLIPGIALWLWWARQRRSTPHTAGAVALLLVLVAAGALSLVAMVANLVLPSAGLTLLNNLPVLTGLATLATVGILASRMDRAGR